MGSSVSKTRTLKKSAEAINETLTRSQAATNHLKKNHAKLDNKRPIESHTADNRVFTERPPAELENGPLVDGDKSLLDKAMRMGVVNVADMPNQVKLDPNHESLRVLNNRKQVERQYEGLFIPRNSEEPDTPERFLTDAQKREVAERFKKGNQKTGKNVFGLVDSSRLSDLIIDYRLEGEEGLKKTAEEIDVKPEAIRVLKDLLDSGLITLPSHKVILEEVKDYKTSMKKQQLKIVKDDWAKTYREQVESEGTDKHNSSTDDVENQIKMLEKLVSKSQVTTKRVEGLSENVEEEQVLNRRKKVLVKEVVREL